ncbi:MAG: hypothetical protein CL678_14560 [Bdellovibrionaceae bacterium]|nr:hypothetical protein [Pseudobdellovibrionaceae bacterium]|tara:strand:- start:123 stop:941 length:819 start_codon:yes stop_codon:yes gene_type:complete
MSDVSVMQTAMRLAFIGLANRINATTAPSTDKLGGLTPTQLYASIRSGVAADADALGGNSLASVVNSVTGGSGETIAALFAALLLFSDRDDNPHLVTKDQLGLGDVRNYGVASEAEALAGTETSAYVTPALVKAMVDKAKNAILDGAPETLDQLSELSAALNDDPGFVTNIMNSIGERISKTDVTALIAAYAARRDNPNQVTASQIGLGQVVNGAMATTQAAIDGVVNDRYLTPALVAAHVTARNLATVDELNDVVDSLTAGLNSAADNAGV